MLRTIHLILPALIPSWRFFDVIAPSPRVEYRRLAAADDAAAHWQEFRPRPTHLAFATTLRRLFWNPGWNETLFLVSCAERLLEVSSTQARDEIFTRIAKDIGATDRAGLLQFRLLVLMRSGDAIIRDIAYVSEPRRIADFTPQ